MSQEPIRATLHDIRCSFCGKPGDQVAAIVCGATPRIAICDQCAKFCREIVAKQNGPWRFPPSAGA